MGSTTAFEREAKRDVHLAEEALRNILLSAMKRRGRGFVGALEAFNRPVARQEVLFAFTPDERRTIVNDWKQVCYRLQLPFVMLMNENGEIPTWGTPEIMDSVRRWFRQGNALAQVRQMDRLHRLRIMDPKMLPRGARNIGIELLHEMQGNPHACVERIIGFVRARPHEIVKRLRETSESADRLLVNSAVAVMKDMATENKNTPSDVDYLVRVARGSLGIDPTDSLSWMNAEAVRELVHDVMKKRGVPEDTACAHVMDDVRACVKVMTLLAEEIRRVILNSDESWARRLFRELARAFFEANGEGLVEELPLRPSGIVYTSLGLEEVPPPEGFILKHGEEVPPLSIAG